MVVESSQWTPSPGESDRQSKETIINFKERRSSSSPGLQRAEHAELRSHTRGRGRSRDAMTNFKEWRSSPRDVMNLRTSLKSDEGGWMRPSLRSENEGPYFTEEPSSLRDVMNLQTSQNSDDGGWMRSSLRSENEGPYFKEVSSSLRDEMNLPTAQKSVDGGWMRSFLRLKEAIMQLLVLMNLITVLIICCWLVVGLVEAAVDESHLDVMNLQTTSMSVLQDGMISSLRAKEAVINVTEEPSAPWSRVKFSFSGMPIRVYFSRSEKEPKRKSHATFKLQFFRSGFIFSSEVEDDAVDQSDLYRMNLSTTQKSIVGGWIRLSLRVGDAVRNSVRRLVRRVSRNTGRHKEATTVKSTFLSGIDTCENEPRRRSKIQAEK